MFKIIDLKHNVIIITNISEHEAHKRVDLLNACGIIRYKARAV